MKPDDVLRILFCWLECCLCTLLVCHEDLKVLTLMSLNLQARWLRVLSKTHDIHRHSQGPRVEESAAVHRLLIIRVYVNVSVGVFRRHE